MPENSENISRGTSVNVQSIKDKLKNVAKANSRLYQELLTVFALERSLYRIGKSKYRENFTLKGGIFSVRSLRQGISSFYLGFAVIPLNRC